MTMRYSTLRPGLLVSLKSTIRGGISYATRTLEPDHIIEDGAQKAKWETERLIADPTEHKAATEARAKARHAVSRICSNSTFGLLCPESKASELETAIADSRAIAEAFNKTARHSQITINVLMGRVAPDDLEAVRAINSEVRDLMTAMEEGIAKLDVEAIRDAANKARGLGAMLTPEAAERVQFAIEAARSAARKIAKAGETAAREVDQQAIKSISAMRTAFLDFDGDEVAAPAAEGRAVDLTPEVIVQASKASARAPVEMEL